MVTAVVEGYDEPLPLLNVTAGERAGKVLAQIRRIGLMNQIVDPGRSVAEVQVNINDREPARRLALATGSCSVLFDRFDLGLYFWNSVFITVVATIITVLFNSMAAFALSKYKFRGRTLVFVLIVATLMIRRRSTSCRSISWSRKWVGQFAMGRHLAGSGDADRGVPARGGTC